jgi:site-specific recombinase XerD
MLMSAGLKTNTHRIYNSAQKRYLNFCELYHLEALPATEDVLLLYVAFLFDQGLKGSTIRVYLAAIRSLHVFLNFVYPQESNRLRLAVKGVVSQSAPPSRKFPITIDILTRMLSAISSRFDFKLIAAAMCCCFFGCFRCSEFCLPDGVLFNVKDHLCVGDVLVNHKERMLSVFLKKSKSDK